MRCPDCARMVSYDEPIVELQGDEEVNSGTVTGTVRIALPCMECGGELKETNLEFEAELTHECDENALICADCGHVRADHDEGGKCTTIDCSCEAFVEPEEDEWELEVNDPESTEDYKPKTDKKGRPISMRYQKHYFGASITGIATCKRCGEVVEFSTSVEEQASAFDELV
jgi:Fe2+ or Zn2+ uptake regulation protein